jgi:hypothetical protein
MNRTKPYEKARGQLSEAEPSEAGPGMWPAEHSQSPAFDPIKVSGRTKLAFALEVNVAKSSRQTQVDMTRRRISLLPQIGQAKFREKRKAKAAPACGYFSRERLPGPFPVSGRVFPKSVDLRGHDEELEVPRLDVTQSTQGPHTA